MNRYRERRQALNGSLGLEPSQHHVSFTQQNSEHDSPPLYKVLPDVITQPIGIRKLLNEVFDGVLSEPEKVRSGDGIRVLTITNGVGLLDDR